MTNAVRTTPVERVLERAIDALSVVAPAVELAEVQVPGRDRAEVLRGVEIPACVILVPVEAETQGLSGAVLGGKGQLGFVGDSV
jgi:hypothetical protein